MKKWITIGLLITSITATGISGGAISFDGVDDRIAVTKSTFDMRNKTFSLWVNPTAFDASDDTMISSTGTTMLFDFNNNGGEIRFRVAADRIKYTVAEGFNPNDFLNKWNHLTVTVVDEIPKLYVNGVLVETGTAVGTTTMSDLSIGRRSNLASPYAGSMDEILFYNKSLTSSEVKAMYASGGAWYPKDGLVSHWSMENNGISTGQPYPNGSTVKDSFGDNDGTINDGADNSMTLESSPVRKKRGRR